MDFEGGDTVQRHITGLTAAAAALGMAATLTACGGSGSGDVTLKLVAADYGDSAANGSQKYWDKLTAAFEKDNPGIKVDVDVYSWNDVDAKVKDMVDAGRAPDMAQIGAYADYAAADKLYPVGDLLDVPTQADFLSQLSDAGKVDNTQYGMPFASSTRLLFYNKKLFKDAGISAPTTWAELEADAKALKADGVRIPYALPLGSEEAQAETMIWMLSGGDGYTDDVGSYTIDSKQNVETFDWLKNDLVAKGLTGPTAPSRLNRADAFAAFAKGEVGMLNGHPTLMQMAHKKGVDYGTVELPGPNGPARSTMGVADWMMAFKQNGHGKEIGTFLNYVYSEQNVLDFSREYDLLPVTTSASETMSAAPEDKKLWPFLQSLSSSELYPVGKTSWAGVSVEIKKQIGAAVSANGSPGAVLGRIQNQAAAAEAAE
ncbi:ABC transporter substrate-binding protein [Streptomyces longispororuber]|uniref:ABC transporter substrate-binding protein n=1 Tax=Streptomyces longispororuber TaxID=68230 RepID=UPI00210947F1|nr:extracellular solute-binding protein [Streptomyces longispororuber]MCQ4212249.1 extracellular solute-binding protein [Streptomyces longispororuber]